LKKVERRNWQAVGAMMAGDFSDRWGHNKATGLQDAREVFSQFFFLTVENRIDNCTVNGGEAIADAIVKVSGNGGPVAELVMQKVNGLRAPFHFTWRHGHAPWDWQLTHIDQSELNLDANASF
jgi:hypothetical protein